MSTTATTRVELTIRDLKDQALAHFPSGRYCANSAWTVIAAVAHNLARWTPSSASPTDQSRPPAPADDTSPDPGRLIRTSRQWTSDSPPAGPGRTDFLTVLTRYARSQPPDSRAAATTTIERPQPVRRAHATPQDVRGTADRHRHTTNHINTKTRKRGLTYNTPLTDAAG